MRFVFFGGFVSIVLFLIADHDVALRSSILFCRKGTYAPSILVLFQLPSTINLHLRGSRGTLAGSDAAEKSRKKSEFMEK